MKYRHLCSLLGATSLLSASVEGVQLRAYNMMAQAQDNVLANYEAESEEMMDNVTDGTDVKVKNIYGIPDEDEKKQALSQKK